MCTSNQYVSDTGAVNISTANSNLDGTGALGVVVSASDFASNSKGTKIDSITIKATGNTTEGMVRLFVDNGGGSITLYKEIYVPAVTQTAVQPAFSAVFNETLTLNPGESLLASTQNAESFNVVGSATAWKVCNCDGECCRDTQYFANTGMGNVTTANSNLDGSGVLVDIVTAPSASPLSAGTQVPYINVKATGSSNLGMVRLFVFDGTSNFLIREIQIPQINQTAVEPAFRGVIPVGLFIKPTWILRASTENSESFDLITFASDWVNCDCEFPE